MTNWVLMVCVPCFVSTIVIQGFETGFIVIFLGYIDVDENVKLDWFDKTVSQDTSWIHFTLGPEIAFLPAWGVFGTKIQMCKNVRKES